MSDEWAYLNQHKYSCENYAAQNRKINEQNMAQQQVFYQSPIGWISVIGTANGIRSVKRVEVAEKSDANAPDLLLQCVTQLEEYFERKRTVFDLKIDWKNATPFNQSVWNTLLEIPYGHTCSYSDIANKINNPAAVRAVGLANRNNPIAIIVPCHRVIGKNGDLTGYFYGVDIKRQLLELENPMSFAQQGSLF